jgi:hypothetical protein
VRFPRKNIFGELPIDPIELAKKINSHRWSNSEMRHYPPTAELFGFLDSLRKKARKPIRSKVVTKEGIEAYYEKGHRFVLDFLWWTSTGTALAVESELSSTLKGMLHDFEKLLCWKSPLKLMIVREHPPGIRADLIARKLSEDAQNMSQFFKGECFVLFIFGEAGKNRAYAYCVLKDRTNRFEFVEIPLSRRKT